MSKRNHLIDYIEITVRNMDASKNFFRKAFGWEFTDYGPEYAGIQGEEREMGGFTVGEPSIGSGAPLVVLYADDLDATLSAVSQAGGEVVKQPFVFPGGRRFHFKEPSGNEMAVWTTS